LRAEEIMRIPEIVEQLAGRINEPHRATHTEAVATANTEKVDLIMENITVTLKKKGKLGTKKVLIKELFATCKGGHVTALMGPSGAGDTCNPTHPVFFGVCEFILRPFFKSTGERARREQHPHNFLPLEAFEAMTGLEGCEALEGFEGARRWLGSRRWKGERN
jgi:hypothetical protein